jgi:hypothetical protein
LVITVIMVKLDILTIGANFSWSWNTTKNLSSILVKNLTKIILENANF